MNSVSLTNVGSNLNSSSPEVCKGYKLQVDDRVMQTCQAHHVLQSDDSIRLTSSQRVLPPLVENKHGRLELYLTRECMMHKPASFHAGRGQQGGGDPELGAAFILQVGSFSAKSAPTQLGFRVSTTSLSTVVP